MKRERTKRRSAAHRLLELIWHNTCDANSHSWERINHAMHDGLRLAIRAGLRFNRRDFAEFAERFRSCYWLINDGGEMIGESVYRLAVNSDNRSAAMSFEQWKARPPYIVDKHDGSRYSDGHFSGPRSGRLAMHFRFEWDGRLVTVTSFAADGQSIVACTYKPRKVDDRGCPVGSERIARRYRITIDDLRAEVSRRRKDQKKVHAEAAEAAEEKTC